MATASMATPRAARNPLAPLLPLLAGLLQRLPEGMLHRLAMGAGLALYWLRPRRRRLVKANLRRVCTYLADQGQASQHIAAAARDDRRLAALARAAFGHYLRGYLEGAILPALARRGVRVEPDDTALADELLAARPVLIIGLHFGAIEVPALWASQHGMAVTAPMETLGDTRLQSYFERSRAATGLRVIPIAGAARELRAVLARGRVAAVVGDRAVGGAGARVELFGAPARLPLGPAVLALESGAVTFLAASRRVGWHEYRGHLERLDLPPGGSRRDRLDAFLAAEARAIERAVARAPEQWWTVFFPIWADIR